MGKAREEKVLLLEALGSFPPQLHGGVFFFCGKRSSYVVDGRSW